MKNSELIEIAKKFDIEGEPNKVKLIDSGHINKTYLVEYNTGKKYILQYFVKFYLVKVKDFLLKIWYNISDWK